MDVGFGSPSSVGVGPGFGSPSSVGVDHGFGSPSGFVSLLPAIIPPIGGAVTDDGGARVLLSAVWELLQTYRVRLVDANGDLWPSAGYCYSGVAGQGYDCTALANGLELPFVVPAVPVGVYSVRVYLGPLFVEESDSVNLLEVKRRLQYAATYRLRNGWPSWFEGPGPRTIEDDYRPEGY